MPIPRYYRLSVSTGTNCPHDRKRLNSTHPGVPLPLPRPPKKKTSTSYPKTSPHQTSHHQCADPRIDSLDSPHLESKSNRPLTQGFTPKTRNRPRVDTVKSTYLNPSCHRTGTTTVPCPKPECDLRYQRIPFRVPPRDTSFKKQGETIPHQVQSGRVTARWVMVILSLVPVRGLTRPSIPLHFHWRAETSSQTFFPRTMDFVFFVCVCVCVHIHTYIFNTTRNSCITPLY